MILLDTHTLVWAALDERKLGRKSRRLIDRFWDDGKVITSAITFWELGLLHHAGRLALPLPPLEWRDRKLAEGLVEIPVNGTIAVRGAGLTGLPGDPIDRLIVATALERSAVLVTADERVLSWKNAALERNDART